MPAIELDRHRLMVRFTGWESLMVRRQTLEVPIGSIDRVEVLPDWTSESLGLRVGLVISGWYKLGTFTHPSGTRRLVAMKRGLPVLRLGLTGPADAAPRFDELLLSTQRASEIASTITSARAAYR
ncbi:hypothetical protein SAMN04489812_1129 [Microlunatus soli]|uniref:Uncharacterized protein n=2 Tax=Microlunatus soli TaxID=630515 RepID=A0A1H1Q3X9_9ACTN|nr:hypothetical protein SAMN04489812_1129 [Microlunatus soli]